MALAAALHEFVSIAPNFTPALSTVGGLVIGAAASASLWGNGKIAGVSGIVGNGLVSPKADRGWREAFVGGMLGAGAVMGVVSPSVFGDLAALKLTAPAVATAGLLVGVGSQLGNGCTSGHGVCGIPRASARSITAVGTFMSTGALTSSAVHHVPALQSFFLGASDPVALEAVSTIVQSPFPWAAPVCAALGGLLTVRGYQHYRARAPPKPQALDEASGALHSPGDSSPGPSIASASVLSSPATATATATATVTPGSAPSSSVPPCVPCGEDESEARPRVHPDGSFPLAVASGATFAVGLGVSGMCDPQKVATFLDVASVTGWDPSLAFVMGGAIALNAPLFHAILRGPRPAFAQMWSMPSRSDITPALVGGAALFGMGWGLGGVCPGPGIVGLASGSASFGLWVASMLAGMRLHNDLVGPWFVKKGWA